MPTNREYSPPGDSLGVSAPNAGDNVTVNITGLPRYETITDNLDHKTFSGSSVTLTADEVNSGLTLTSNYHGHGRPTATLTVTATDNTGTPMTSAAQSITVVDPPATTTSSGTTGTTGTHAGTSTTTSWDATSSGQSYHHWSDHHHHHPHPHAAGETSSSGTSVTTPTGTSTSGGTTASGVTSSSATTTDPTGSTSSGGSSVTTGTSSSGSTSGSGTSTTTSAGGTSSGQSQWFDHHHAVAATGSGTSTTTSGTSSSQSHASHTNVAQWFNDHPDFAPAATTLSEAEASRSGAAPNVATTTTNPTASAGAKAYALFNQMMAGDFGGESHFAQAATTLSASSQQQANLLTKPLH
jgi:hypothetical protein